MKSHKHPLFCKLGDEGKMEEEMEGRKLPLTFESPQARRRRSKAALTTLMLNQASTWCGQSDFSALIGRYAHAEAEMSFPRSHARRATARAIYIQGHETPALS